MLGLNLAKKVIEISRSVGSTLYFLIDFQQRQKNGMKTLVWLPVYLSESLGKAKVLRWAFTDKRPTKSVCALSFSMTSTLNVYLQARRKLTLHV